MAEERTNKKMKQLDDNHVTRGEGEQTADLISPGEPSTIPSHGKIDNAGRMQFFETQSFTAINASAVEPPPRHVLGFLPGGTTSYYPNEIPFTGQQEAVRAAGVPILGRGSGESADSASQGSAGDGADVLLGHSDDDDGVANLTSAPQTYSTSTPQTTTAADKGGVGSGTPVRKGRKRKTLVDELGISGTSRLNAHHQTASTMQLTEYFDGKLWWRDVDDQNALWVLQTRVVEVPVTEEASLRVPDDITDRRERPKRVRKPTEKARS